MGGPTLHGENISSGELKGLTFQMEQKRGMNCHHLDRTCWINGQWGLMGVNNILGPRLNLTMRLKNAT